MEGPGGWHVAGAFGRSDMGVEAADAQAERFFPKPEGIASCEACFD